MNRKKVLLIDEDDTILDIYSSLLIREGYCVSTVNNGNKALEMLHRQPFDIVITDLAMRRENGQTVLEEIRGNFPLTPVIALTDSLSNTAKLFALSMGAFALIVKPCGCEILLSFIRKSLRAKRKYQ